MQREVKIIFIIVSFPLFIWAIRASYFFGASWTSKGVEMITKSEIRISTRLIGQRFTPAFPDEIILTNGEKFIWENMNYQVRLNESQQVLKVHSIKFSQDTVLKFNGRRWHGFANIPGRKLPIEVDIW